MVRSYNLRRNYTLERKQDYTVYHGSENLPSLSLSFPCSQIIESSTKPHENSATFKEFKTKTNSWATEHTPCGISKKYCTFGLSSLP